MTLKDESKTRKTINAKSAKGANHAKDVAIFALFMLSFLMSTHKKLVTSRFSVYKKREPTNFQRCINI
jgi:hypothetical protein